LRFLDEVLVSDDVKGCLELISAMSDQSVEELSMILSHNLDPPLPPLGEVSSKVECRFDRVVHSVCKGSVRHEHIKGVAHTADDLVTGIFDVLSHH